MTITGGELALGSEGFDLGSDGGDNIIYVNGGKIRANAANVTLNVNSMTCNATSTANSFQVGANGVTFDTGANTMTQNMLMNDRSGSTGGKAISSGVKGEVVGTAGALKSEIPSSASSRLSLAVLG